MVPTTKGCIPKAPDGGHNSQAGTLLEGAAVAPGGDPLVVAREDEFDAAVPSMLDGVPVPPPADPEPAVEVADVGPVAVAPVAVVVVDWAEIDGFAEFRVVVLVPRLTTPPNVTVPGVAVVCAAAGTVTAIENSSA